MYLLASKLFQKENFIFKGFIFSLGFVHYLFINFAEQLAVPTVFNIVEFEKTAASE